LISLENKRQDKIPIKTVDIADDCNLTTLSNFLTKNPTIIPTHAPNATTTIVLYKKKVFLIYSEWKPTQSRCCISN
jgi:hypothetical protein